MLEFEKKVYEKNHPRPAAFKTTFSFGIDFLWSHPSKLNQIQIMWSFWHKLYFHAIILAFKGQEGQKRPSNFFLLNSAEQNFITKSFIFKKMQLLFFVTSRTASYQGVYFTSAWPCWPLKANFFSPNNFYYHPRLMVKVW